MATGSDGKEAFSVQAGATSGEDEGGLL